MLKSMWHDTINKKNYPELKENIKTDVLIIGGGITGISCAYELKDHFDNITLVTMNELYSGTTGYTTAKITYQHGYLYYDLLKKLGLKKALSYYQFNKKGLNRISEIIKKENIDCDYKEVSSYLFSYQNEEKNLKNEFRAYDEIGIKGKLTTIDDLSKLALQVDNQGQFNPLKYLQKLIGITNIKIYENTQIINIEVNTAFTKNNKITADYIIVATNYPIYPNHNLFFTKLIPSVSYVIAGKPNKQIKNGNYINTTSPIVSIRYQNDIMLLGGMSHKTKYIKKPNEEYNKLTEIGNKYFELEYQYGWSTRDFISIDNLPFVGHLEKNIFVATGFGKWGMTNSVASSILIKDLILNKDNRFKKVFNPRRCIISKSYLKYNITMPKTIIKSKKIYEHISKLDKGEGKVIKLRFTRYGVYRDDNNKVHIVKACCTHLGCGLLFNKVDRTYDCPCHGSKFNFDGKVIAGPAKKNLKRIIIKNKDL